MGPITAIIPRPSTIKLGTEDYRVGEFRLIDIADLQSFIDDIHSDPIASIRGSIEVDGIENNEKALALAYKEADAPYRFVYGEYHIRDQQELYLCTLNFMHVALKRYQGGMTLGKIKAIAGSLEPGQLSNLNRIVWATAPVDEIGKLLGMRHRRERNNTTWPKVIVETLGLYPGYTLESLYNLTLTEFWFLRSGGKEKKVGQWEIKGSMKEAAEERRNWWQRIMGKPDA